MNTDISFMFNEADRSYVLSCLVNQSSDLFKKESDYLSFDNELNSLLFPPAYTARDYDIFFTLCWFAKKQKDASIITVPFSELSRFYKEIMFFCDKTLGKKHLTSWALI